MKSLNDFLTPCIIDRQHQLFSGRILNRFTKDIGAIDEIIPMPILDFVYVIHYLLY